MNSNNIQETFFNLRTLTLRDRLPPRDGPGNSVTSSQQPIYTQSPTPSSQTSLSKFRLILASNWKWVASFLIGASYIIFIVSLYSHNNQLIQNNTRLLEQGLAVSSKSSSSEESAPVKYLPVLQDKKDSSGFKKLLLSASSQQSQINKLSNIQEDLEAKLKALQENFDRSSKTNNAVFEAFIRESNISFCAGESEKKLLAPLSAIYRVDFSAKVQGNTYINRKMFHVTKNTQILRNGGVLRIRYNGTENKSVDCGMPRGQKKTCFYMEETILVNMKTSDVLQVKDVFSSEGGHVYDLKFCMAISDRLEIPGNEESLVITH